MSTIKTDKIIPNGQTLAVESALSVGNFNGNVMPKATGPGGGLAIAPVGRVVPFFCYGGGAPTTLLSAGTWFVHFTGSSNNNASVSTLTTVNEDPILSGAFTVTVASGNYFGLQVYHDAGAAARPEDAHLDRSGVIYRHFVGNTLQNTSVPVSNTSHAVPTGWSEFTETSLPPYKAKQYNHVAVGGSGVGSAPTISNDASVVYGSASGFAWVVCLHGYAMRIA